MTLKLAQLQGAIQNSILGDNPDALKLLRDPPLSSKTARLDVYRDGYLLRLTEFLAHDHPKLKCYLGETRFAALARAYVSRYPSDTPNARWFSRHLPDFLRSSHEFARKPELAELAEFERALNEAFDAPEAPIIGMADFAALQQNDVAAMSFSLAPSMRRFKVRTNVTSLWASLRCDEEPPKPFKLDADQELLVWRQGSASRFRMLGNEEAMALDSAAAAVPFGVICEMIAAMDDGDTAAMRAATYLRGWIEAEIISGLNFEAQPRGSNQGQCA